MGARVHGGRYASSVQGLQKAVDITAVSTDNFTQLSIFTELLGAARSCRTHGIASLLTRHAYVRWRARTKSTTDESTTSAHSFCKEGLAHFRFHPANLPERSTLPPTSEVRIKQ